MEEMGWGDEGGAGQCEHCPEVSDILRLLLASTLSSEVGDVCDLCLENHECWLGDPASGVEGSTIWVCLECGSQFCSMSNTSMPVGHVRRHARAEHHPCALRRSAPAKGWCFICNTDVYIEMPDTPPAEPPTLETDVPCELPWNGGCDMLILPAEPIASAGTGAGYMIRGLKNLGNTCFFNSVLQNLLAMDVMRENITCLAHCVGALTKALRNVYLETSTACSSSSTLIPKILFAAICAKAPQFKGHHQQDSHELLRCLLNMLQMEECDDLHMEDEAAASRPDKPQDTMVDAIFGGELSSIVTCVECGHRLVVCEPFLDLSLPVPSKKHPVKAMQPSLTDKSKEDVEPRSKQVARGASLMNGSSKRIEADHVLDPNGEVMLEFSDLNKEGNVSNIHEDLSWLDFIGPEVDDPTVLIGEYSSNEWQDNSGLSAGPQRYTSSPEPVDPSDICGDILVEELPAVDTSVVVHHFKEEDHLVLDCEVREGLDPHVLTEDYSAFLIDDEPEESFVGLGDLFNEPDETYTVGKGRIYTSLSPDYSEDEVDDNDGPASVASCLTMFTKLELLTGDHAWRCVKCAEASSSLKSSEVTKYRTNVEHMTEDLSTKAEGSEDQFQNGGTNSFQGLNHSIAKFSFGSEAATCSLLAATEPSLPNANDDGNVDGDSEEPSEPLAPTKAVQMNGSETNPKAFGSDQTLSVATKRYIISKAPSILTIHLKRFGQDYRGRFVKLKGHVSFEEVLNITPFTEPSCAEKENCTYRLLGVVEHIGTIGSGHYVAYVKGNRISSKTKDGEGRLSSSWFYASDDRIKVTSLADVLEREAYILFYERNK